MLSLQDIKTIAIGSKNPVKLNAVKLAFEKLGSSDIFIISVDEPEMRGISHQPLSKQETLQGAKNRADYCFEMHPEVDMVFGIEGGVDFSFSKEKCFLFGVVYARDKDGYESYSFGGDILLPTIVRDRLLQGEELGPIIDSVVHAVNTKQGVGTAGILTNGVLYRTTGFTTNVIQTMIPWINKERGWY